MQNQWLTRTQAAAFLNCHPDTISAIAQEMDAANAGGVTRTSSGRLFRVEQNTLSQFISERGKHHDY